MRKLNDDVPVSSELQRKLLQVHERLCAEYHCPIPFFSNRDPLSLLVSSLLSHRTKNADTGRAVRHLHNTFDSWEAIRDAPVAEVQAAIAAATWPELKAPRIQQVLRLITERLESYRSIACLPCQCPKRALGWSRCRESVRRPARRYCSSATCDAKHCPWTATIIVLRRGLLDSPRTSLKRRIDSSRRNCRRNGTRSKCTITTRC